MISMMHKLCFIKMRAKSLLFMALSNIMWRLDNNQNLRYPLLKQNSGFQHPQNNKTPPLCMRNGV